MQGDAIGSAYETSAYKPDLLDQDAGPVFGYEEPLTCTSGE